MIQIKSVSFKALYGFDRLGANNSQKREIDASKNHERKPGNGKITPPPVEKGRNISFQTGEQIVEKHASNINAERRYYEQQRPSVKTENTRRANTKCTPEEEASKQRVIQMFRMEVAPIHGELAERRRVHNEAVAMLNLLEDTPADKFPFFERVCNILNMRRDWDDNNLLILLADSKEILALYLKFVNNAPLKYNGNKEQLLKTITNFVDTSLKIGAKNNPDYYSSSGRRIFKNTDVITSAFFTGLQAPDVFDRFLRDAHKIKSQYDYVFTFCGKEYADADQRKREAQSQKTNAEWGSGYEESFNRRGFNDDDDDDCNWENIYQNFFGSNNQESYRQNSERTGGSTRTQHFQTTKEKLINELNSYIKAVFKTDAGKFTADTSTKDLKAAFRKLLIEVHPDKHKGSEEYNKLAAKINELRNKFKKEGVEV